VGGGIKGGSAPGLLPKWNSVEPKFETGLRGVDEGRVELAYVEGDGKDDANLRRFPYINVGEGQ